ncbi:MAG: winged helix-turn-helix domain-containing protein, partial [Candidatus Binatia bacterium]
HMPDEALILVLEGPLSEGLSETVAAEGWQVRRITCLEELAEYASERVSLILVDLLRPDMDLAGYYQVEGRFQTPIRLIVPRGKELPAPPVLRLPIDRATLIQLIATWLNQTQDRTIRVGALTIDLDARRILREDQLIRLSPLEFRLLVYLAAHVGIAVRSEALYAEVWNYPPEARNAVILNTVARCVSRIRKKLGTNASQPEHIVTSRGFGYRLRSHEQWLAFKGRHASDVTEMT